MKLNTFPKFRLSREETRQRIVEEADALFRRLGFGKTTVNDIADALAMSPANLYKFFPSKMAIIEASAERNLGQLKDEVLAAAAAEPGFSSLDRLEAVVRAISRFNEELLSQQFEIFKLVTVAMEENWACCREFDAFLHEVVAGLLRDGMQRGEIAPEDPYPLAQSVIDCLVLAIRPHLHWPSDLPNLESRTRAQLQLIARALRTAPTNSFGV